MSNFCIFFYSFLRNNKINSRKILEEADNMWMSLQCFKMANFQLEFTVSGLEDNFLSFCAKNKLSWQMNHGVIYNPLWITNLSNFYRMANFVWFLLEGLNGWVPLKIIRFDGWRLNFRSFDDWSTLLRFSYRH